MKPMPAWERASLLSASGRHACNAVAKSPRLNADNPVRNSSSGEAAPAGQIAATRAATARKIGISFTGISIGCDARRITYKERFRPRSRTASGEQFRDPGVAMLRCGEITAGMQERPAPVRVAPQYEDCNAEARRRGPPRRLRGQLLLSGDPHRYRPSAAARIQGEGAPDRQDQKAVA